MGKFTDSPSAARLVSEFKDAPALSIQQHRRLIRDGRQSGVEKAGPPLHLLTVHAAFEGPVNVSHLEAALRLVLERHPYLLDRFFTNPPRVDYDALEVDESGVMRIIGEPDAASRFLMRSFADCDPRIRVVFDSEGRWVRIAADHLLMDEPAIMQFLTELASAYASNSWYKRKNPVVPYRDYAFKQREMLARSIEFWLRQDALSSASFLFHYPGLDEGEDGRSGTVEVVERCKSEDGRGGSPLVNLLAEIALVSYKVNQESASSVWIPIRHQPISFRETLGWFSIPMPIRLPQTGNLDDARSEISRSVANAIRYPCSLDMLGLRKGAGPTLFVTPTTSVSVLNFGGVRARLLPSRVHYVRHGGFISHDLLTGFVRLEFDTGIWDPVEAARFTSAICE